MPVRTLFSQPLTRSRLHDEIVALIQKQILTGALAPGTRLPPERELAESFKVNRATVREALRKLEHIELVEIRHGDGVYVKDFRMSGNVDLIRAAVSLDDGNETLFNVLEVRRIVVPEMAYLSAQRRNAADLADLEQIIIRPDLTLMERDIRVHQMIARASRNLLYTIMLNFFDQLFRDYIYLYFDNEKNITRSRTFHQEIFKAIKHQEPEEARRIMLEVLVFAEKSIMDALAEKQ
ncbi:MAG: FadR/GntR family transcriptional regulator [Desulfosalsimonadaceae bacterium]|nr:FadR/GntR family transcriptional regulator [Desulfosalsimonadaceae bacterium]